ncbi:MAG TPA: glycine cleavage system protein GcvH [Spirochaetota bacterium]|nr:glycine cleavage system protein GcvH [Spirochaetota bacterium]
MDIPKDLKYTKEHEWAKEEGDTALLGITDFAQHSLGDVVFVELPEVGTQLKKGEAFGSVESVKAASDIYSPLSGEVIEINSELEDHPELLNESPYEKGWIIKIRVSDSGESAELMNEAKYAEFVEKEEQ